MVADTQSFRQRNARILARLEEMHQQYLQLEGRISDPEEMKDTRKYPGLIREHSSLAGAAKGYAELKRTLDDLDEAQRMAADEPDAEMRELAEAEVARLEPARDSIFEDLKARLVRSDPENQRNIIMEIRAGTGGEEAALFAGDLFRMYEYYFQKQGWKVEVMDSSPAEMGGLKEVVFAVKGQGAFGRMRFESGGHRVQRVPETETQGRIHTSAATVAVLPEVEEVDIEIRDQDIRVDRMRAGGPGGQSVNKTESAIRVTHEPSGLVVRIQDEKSQHKNLAKAMKILRSRLYDLREEKKRQERDTMRRTQIGSGDRSERIRTYNFPQNRMTDHRIGLTLYNLDRLIEGDLDAMLDALQKYDEQQRLEAL